jgi:hypothetical protein
LINNNMSFQWDKNNKFINKCILPICNEYFLQILDLFYLKYIIFNNESIIPILK